MVMIEGTNKIKGILELSGIKRQLKRGDRLPISEEQFYDNTVQIAINMGLITHSREGTINVDEGLKTISLRSIYDRSIRINAINSEIRPGQQFSLTEDQVNSTEIRSALAKGFLELVTSARIKGSTESTVKVGNLFESSVESQTIPYLETNEEASDPSVVDHETNSKVIDVLNPRPVEKKDIKDPKGSTVVWNPNRDPVAHTMSTMKNVSTSNKKESSVNVKDEITFVDADQDAKRRASHPVLKNKPEKAKTDEIDFL